MAGSLTREDRTGTYAPPMHLLRLAGTALVTLALVGGCGVAAFAEDGDGVCTITVQLPETAESGQPFTMQVLEDRDCAGVRGLPPFSSRYLGDSPLRWADTGIDFTHTPGSGSASYQGTAPNPGSWHPLIFDLGSDPGYEVVLSTMRTTPQVTPTPTTPPAKAVWLNGTLRITYPHAPLSAEGGDGYWTVYVDGKRVSVDEYSLPGDYGAVQIPRAASAGPAKVEIVATSVPDLDHVDATNNRTTFSRTITQHVVKAKKGQVLAATLLDRLKVRAETRSSSYSRPKFTLWVDANHDGENTRAEVLKSESLKTPKVSSRGIVMTGKWISRYDGKTYTDASRLDIDHLVPLKEAWTSGAAGWSAKMRTAYANDTGYGPSLNAVSKAAHDAKGADEITKYLPSKTSYRCAYVRNWIAVKYRWGLTIDPTEKNMLNSDLTLYCSNPYVTKPATPNLTALVGRRGK